MVTTWRPAFEQEIISPATRAVLDPIVIRPGLVFGGASTVLSFWFSALLEGKKNQKVAEVVAKKEALIPTVHKDDLGEAYRLIVEKVLLFLHSCESSMTNFHLSSHQFSQTSLIQSLTSETP